MSLEIAPSASGSAADLMDPILKAKAEQAVKSGVFGKLTLWEAAAKISTADELGISPMIALQSVWIVSGRLVLSYSLLGSLVQNSKRFRYRVLQNDDQAAQIAFHERVGDTWEQIGVSTFTIGMAKRAGLLSKQPWQQYPEAMLFARALSQGVRMMTPSLTTAPAYVQGEIDEPTEANEIPPVNAQPAAPRPVRERSFGPAVAPAGSKDETLRATIDAILEANGKL